MMATRGSLQDVREEMARLKTAALRREFEAGLSVAADRLRRAGCALLELEGRGEKIIPSARYGRRLLDWLRRIGGGELLAELVERFAADPDTLAGVLRLTPEEQAALAGASDEELAARFAPTKGGGPSLAERSVLRLASEASPLDLATLIDAMTRKNASPAAAALAAIERLAPIAGVTWTRVTPGP